MATINFPLHRARRISRPRGEERGARVFYCNIKVELKIAAARGIIGRGDATNFQVEVSRFRQELAPSPLAVCPRLFPFFFPLRLQATRVVPRTNKPHNQRVPPLFIQRGSTFPNSDGPGSCFPRPLPSRPRLRKRLCRDRVPRNKSHTANCRRYRIYASHQLIRRDMPCHWTSVVWKRLNLFFSMAGRGGEDRWI